MYERAGLVQPKRSAEPPAVLAARTSSGVRQIQRLVADLGVNLAGAR